MYKTGDINQNLERLKIELKKIKYSIEIFESENISNGNPVYFLPIIHYVILDYSKHIAKTLVDNNYELFSKTDEEFISKAFKAMIDLFNFKPNITIKQFFSFGYSEAKVILCLEIIRIIKTEHNHLVKKLYSSKPPVNKNKRNNDSFRSVRNNEVDSFIDYSSNLGGDGGNRAKEDFDKKVKGNKLPVNRLIEEDFPNTTSPKFSEQPINVRKNYNFDRRVLKRGEPNEKRYVEVGDDCSGDESEDNFHRNYLHEQKIRTKNYTINKNDKMHNAKEFCGNFTEDETEKEKEYLNFEHRHEDELDEPKPNSYNKDISKNNKNQNNNSNRYNESDSNNFNSEKRKINPTKEKEVRDDYIINFKENPENSKKIRRKEDNTEDFTEKSPNKEIIDNNQVNNKKSMTHTNSNKKAKEKKEQHYIHDDINTESNYNSANRHDDPPVTNKNRNNSNNNLIELSSFIEIINSLADSVKDMTGKVDNFKINMENRVEKLEAELTLIKNRLSLLENKNSYNSQIHVPNYNRNVFKDVHESNLNNTHEENEHIFSFADDANSNVLQNQLVNRLETIYEDEKKNSKDKNKIFIESNKNNTNTISNRVNIKDQNSYNTYSNKLPNKIMHDIEDTDTIIQRIANRFKETQKLLNEFK